MSRSSPSVQRVVAILNFFAAHPGQSFSLTDLVRSLKLSRATCHGVLVGLLEAGYLYRTSDKNYVLGSALIHVSEVAKAHFSPLQIAQPEMRKLADDFGAVCVAAFRERHEVILRERAVAVSLLGYSPPRNTRHPLLPQFAPPFLTALSPAELKTWIDGFSPPCPQAQVDAMHKGLDFVHKHGYLFSVTRPGAEIESESTQWLRERSFFDTPIIPKFELIPTDIYKLSSVSAPVLDAQGRVAFVLAVLGIHREITGVELARIGKQLCDACQRITASMGYVKSEK